MKAVAVEIAFVSEDKDKKSIISELIKTERNLVLKKGDVSLSQLRDIAERDGDAVVLNFIKSFPESLSGAASKLFRR
jgi:hypothetical protein